MKHLLRASFSGFGIRVSFGFLISGFGIAQRDDGALTGKSFLPNLCQLNGEGEDDVFYFGQRLAGLEIAPSFAVPVGKAAEAIALHDGEVFYRAGVRFFLFAYGKVAHALNRDWFNLHKILKAAAESSHGSSTDSDYLSLNPDPDQVLWGNTQEKEKSFKKVDS